MNKFAVKSYKRFPLHLNNVPTLRCDIWIVGLLILHALPLSCESKKLENLSHLNRGPQIRQIWTRLGEIRRVENNARVYVASVARDHA